MHHLRSLAFVLCAATIFTALPASSTSLGLYVEAGPGLTQLTPDGGGTPRTFVPLVPRFGLWAEDVYDKGFFLDMDLTLLMGAAVNGIDLACCGGGLSKLGQDLAYPKATDGSAASVNYAHAFRFTTGGPIADTPIPGLQIGGGFDFDIGIQTALNPNSTPDPTPHGDVYIALGFGPAVIWNPARRVRVYAYAGPGAFIANNRDIFTGLQVAGAANVLFTIFPRYLDLKGTLIGEHRVFFDGKFDPPNRGAGFTTFAATVGLVGKFGWMFGVDEELQEMERNESSSSTPSPSPSSDQRG